MANPGDFAYTVKQQADIVRIVGDYVKLKKAGGPNFSGLCPFHKEKTPSFTVHVTRQFYKCFSCGAAGDVFKFVMEIEGLSFPEALKSLAERNGIPIPKRSQYADDDSRLRGSLLAMHELAHLLGFARGVEAFEANLVGRGFAGAHVVSLLGGPGPLAGDLGHWQQNFHAGRVEAWARASLPLAARLIMRASLRRHPSGPIIFFKLLGVSY